jgi:hypothetical protein
MIFSLEARTIGNENKRAIFPQYGSLIFVADGASF